MDGVLRCQAGCKRRLSAGAISAVLAGQTPDHFLPRPHCDPPPLRKMAQEGEAFPSTLLVSCPSTVANWKPGFSFSYWMETA